MIEDNIKYFEADIEDGTKTITLITALRKALKDYIEHETSFIYDDDDKNDKRLSAFYTVLGQLEMSLEFEIKERDEAISGLANLKE